MGIDRQAWLELASGHGLDAPSRQRLLALAEFDAEPAALKFWLPRGLGIVGAALGGLGVIFWVAANWGSLGRLAQMALLQAWVLVTALGAWARPGAARAPLALLAFLGIGALLAFIGQTYQTGADPWQLFALWALLGLPLAWAVRHDIVWAPWAAVAMTGVALWQRTHTAHRWRFEAQDLQPQALAALAAVLLVLLLGTPLRRLSGAGAWALRTAVMLASVLLAGLAIGGLLQSSVGLQYPLGLLTVAAGVALMASRRWFDLFALSALALALNVLLIGGLVRLLFAQPIRSDPISQLLVIGLVAAGLLAFSVSQILKLARQRAAQGTGEAA